MFNPNDLRALLYAKPFVRFRLMLSDGGTVEVRSPEAVTIGRHWAVVGLLDPQATDTLFDRFTIIYYLHVARVEYISPGSPPFAPPAGPSQSPTPAPV